MAAYLCLSQHSGFYPFFAWAHTDGPQYVHVWIAYIDMCECIRINASSYEVGPCSLSTTGIQHKEN